MRCGTLISGSIPACAGEPASPAQRRPSPRVYPRVCGGTPVTTNLEDLHTGLSPRVRGNHTDTGRPVVAHGSIPACAGEPHRCLAVRTPSRVYPRVCGGTVARLSKRQHHRVYPRVCGGTWRVFEVSAHTTGLSPRVRGNRPGRGRTYPWHGSIPACAGEPDTPSCPLYRGWVYPRVCGGTCENHGHPFNVRGLSPRVRGNPPCRPASRISAGSIPACAGEPRRCFGTSRQSRVYPRVCGGTPSEGQRQGLAAGLSPRVRGNRL